MSVSGSADTTATSGAQARGVPQHLLTSRDFIAVRAELIRELGGDANRAVVLTRIHFRADERWREAVEVDGFWWWRANRETIAAETGLSVDQVKRITSWLVTNGYLISAAHQLEGTWDQTRSFRVNTVGAESPNGRAESPELGADLHRSIGAESPNPPIQTLRTSSKHAIPIDWQPDAETRAWALALGNDVDHLRAETERFRNHYLSLGEVRADWNPVWRNWISRPPLGGARRQRAPQRDRMAEMESVIEIGRRLDAEHDAAQAATAAYVPAALEGL